ncbi:SLBB domain-containing protein [bacterium]|nr:SLBB domain-containing protein [bacterium]
MLINTPDEIRGAIKAAGVIGAGGAGFPTYFKLNAKVDTVIANGSECEPLLYTDKTVIKQMPRELIRGLKIAMKATGAQKGIIAVKGHYKDVVSAIKNAISQENAEKDGISIHELENYYPAGDEFLTVYDVTGRVIPEGGIPLNVGVVVSNVLSLIQVAQAIDGKVVTERAITVTGEVINPGVYTVPIGTTYNSLIEIAGGLKSKDVALIDGGPMMGKIVSDWERGVNKTTSGIILLPKDHFVIRMASKSLAQVVKQSKAACCQCFRCTDLCPRNLLGHQLYPHKTMQTIDYDLVEPTANITSAFLCSQCGMCELVACDFMQLSPRKVYAEYRKLLVAKGIKNPHNRSGFDVSSQYENRKVSIPTVIKKLGLTEYARPLYPKDSKAVSIVRINVKAHIGAPATILVSVGDILNIGDLIASSPEGGLGTAYHSSIIGRVTAITVDYIEITAN